MRAALAIEDHPLADRQTAQLMLDVDAKKVFGTIRTQYALHGRENDFREIQKQVAPAVSP